jgi:hypothetical protein
MEMTMVPNQYGQFSFLLMMERMRKSELCNWITLLMELSLWMLWFSLSESKYGRFKTDVTIAFYLITFNDSDILKQLILMVMTVNCWYTLTQELIILLGVPKTI